MRIVFFTLFSMLLQATALQAQPSTTKIADVVTEFYSNYDTDTLGYPRVFFEKRAGQWIVITKKFDDDKLVETARSLFYDETKHYFESLPIKRYDTAIPVAIEQHMDAYDIRNFDLQLYYGYEGWYKDVIAALKDKPALTDDQLNGLARAYETLATGMLTAASGDIAPGDMMDLPFSHNSMSAAQIAEFSTAQQKAIDLFEKLARRSPDYSTSVGNARIKLANEIMVRFHLLLTFASDYAMSMPLPVVSYPDSLLQKTKAALNACPRGAIFLSFGDNDFYPVLYLQHVKKFRPDIHLINYNLIGVDRFLHRALFPQFAASPISMSADSAVYRNPKNIFLYIGKGETDATVDQLMGMLKDTGNRVSSGYAEMKAENLLLNKRKVHSSHGQPKLILGDILHLTMNQWALLDIMNNAGSRSICMMNEFFDELQGLNKFLEEKNGILIYPGFN